jgi:hypothetical protein
MPEHDSESTEQTTPSEPAPLPPDVVSDHGPDLSVEVVVELGERMSVIRCTPLANTWDRPRDRGPFGSEHTPEGERRAELLDELGRVCAVRTRRATGLAAFERRGSWGQGKPLVIGCPPGEVAEVAAALRTLFAAGDERGLRDYMASPMAPRVDREWSPPDPR